jgi:Dimethlysulfonioproprionate lyase
MDAGALLADTHRLLESLRAPALAPFLAAWPGVADARPPDTRARQTPAASAELAVLAWLPRCAADPCCLDPKLVADLCAAAPRLLWRQSYRQEEVGSEFLQNYAWTELLGASGEGSRLRIACGALLLGPRTFYPPHHHEAEEVYVPVSGTAEWLQGDGVWRRWQPGTSIHHRSQETHAMRTGLEPLLALYLWRGADLSAARLDLRRAG